MNVLTLRGFNKLYALHANGGQMPEGWKPLVEQYILKHLDDAGIIEMGRRLMK